MIYSSVNVRQIRGCWESQCVKNCITTLVPIKLLSKIVETCNLAFQFVISIFKSLSSLQRISFLLFSATY